ncbi:MAG: hypothetical protein IJG38_04420 [Thermoguttaceae bacterium]|nr:hypothetical protein [Thermoguttaceae bacterium]
MCAIAPRQRGLGAAPRRGGQNVREPAVQAGFPAKEILGGFRRKHRQAGMRKRPEKNSREVRKVRKVLKISLRSLRSLRLKTSSADFVRDPEALLTTSQIISEALGKAASSRRTLRQ